MNIIKSLTVALFLIMCSPAQAQDVYANGDSHVVGVGASPSSKGQIQLFSPINGGVNGSQAAEVSTAIQLLTPVSGNKYYIMVGTNDHRQYKNDAVKQGYFKNFMRQAIIWLKQPDRVHARDVAMTKTGTWTNTAVNSFGMRSTVAGSTMSATVSGTTVYVGYIIQNYPSVNGSSFTVTIDGVNKGSYSSYGVIDTVNGLTYAPAALRFDGLSSGNHTVVITQNSGGKIVYIDYITGNDVTADDKDVLVSNVIQMSSSAYTAYGTSLSNVNAFNTIINDLDTEFTSDGFNVEVIDNFNSIDPTLHLDTDGVHMNNAGHAIAHTNLANAL